MPTIPQVHDLALARHSAHCGEHAAGLRACQRLLSRGLPPLVEAEVRAARTWYVPSLDDLLPGGVIRQRITCRPFRPGWTLFNPSMLSLPDGTVLLLVRSSNYRIAADGCYVFPAEDQADGGPWVRTGYVLTRIDPRSLRQVDRPVPLLGPDYPTSGMRITGVEDLRLRWRFNRVAVSGTCLNAASHPDGLARIATATLDGACLRNFELLDEPFPGRNEKNWVPIEGPKVTWGRWLYSAWEDGHVATVQRSFGWQVTKRAASPWSLRHLRGRSQLVKVGPESWLGIFGEATDDGRRMYDHRFVWFGGDELQPVAWSPPFRFGPLRGVEFCAGLVLAGEQLVASYGLRDEEAWLAQMPMAAVQNLMEEIP
ncbi:MAG: hypothetical protein EBZ59_08530 [Planctomycetia bacterium]|nr:hypothetical protein [Planctomycetia bacterium]